MTFTMRREKLRAILAGDRSVRPGSVFDPLSMRIAQDVGYEVGLLGGSIASLVVLGYPDLVLITLSELAEQVRRMSRAAILPFIVDADHGYGNALNVRRTVEELECAGAAGITIEDTLLPQAFGARAAQLISLDEGVGKMKAALAARLDPSFVIIGRSAAASITDLDDAIARVAAYEAAGVDALFLTGITSREALEKVANATRLPLMLGGVSPALDDPAYLSAQRVRIANQGHTPIAAAMEAMRATMQALRDGVPPKELQNLAAPDLTARLTRDAHYKELIARLL